MEEALAKEDAVSASPRAKALFVAGTMACDQADHGSATGLLDESLGLFRELNEERRAAYALSSAGFAAVRQGHGQGQHERGITLLEEAVDLSLEAGEKWGAAFVLCFLAMVRRDQGIGRAPSGWRSEGWPCPGR